MPRLLASNLDVPFPELKKLTADAGNRDFAKAIATLKPGVNAKAEEQKAIKQSRQTFPRSREIAEVTSPPLTT